MKFVDCEKVELKGVLVSHQTGIGGQVKGEEPLVYWVVISHFFVEMAP
jgi:hypothetical protein